MQSLPRLSCFGIASQQVLVACFALHRTARPVGNGNLANIKNNRPFPKDLRVVGPLPSIMEKKSGVFRWEVNVFSASRKSLHEFLDLSQAFLYRPSTSKKVRWSLDIDPVSSM